MADNIHEENENIKNGEEIEKLVMPGDILDRKKLLQLTSTLITTTAARVSGQRFRPQDGDAQRIAFIKAARDLIALHDALLRGAAAPKYQGIPVPPRPEDTEALNAILHDLDNEFRIAAGLPPRPKPEPARA